MSFIAYPKLALFIQNLAGIIRALQDQRTSDKMQKRINGVKMGYFIAHNKVRMHDTDMAGVIFYANQFRYAQEALEDLFELKHLSFKILFKTSPFIFLIVHADSDYIATLSVGDHLEIHVGVEKMGHTSLTFQYLIYRDGKLVGKAHTVHVCLDRKNHAKIPIPDGLKKALEDYHVNPHTHR